MANTLTRRPDPEELLRQLQAAEEEDRRGRLKVFLGYASGVGKSTRMLEEARRRRKRGQDVVVAGVQPAISRADVQNLIDALEVVPQHMRDGVPVIDVEAILKRHPQVCLVDGLAYDNPAGSRNPKRWLDVVEILDAGISVITSVNLQFIAELQPEIEKITGKRASQTVPQSFLMEADEIEIVDAPPEYLLRSGAAGDKQAIARQQQQLSALRELALLLAADVVDHQLERYLRRHGIEQIWGTQERILVCITPRTPAEKMIASGRRNADRFHGELFVMYVQQNDLSASDRAALDRNITLARNANATVEIVREADPVEAIMCFARAHGVTQIFVGHSPQTSWWERIKGSTLDRLIRKAEAMDVRVFPHE